MLQRHVQFKPRAALYIIHHRLLYLIEQKCYSEAYLLINEEHNLQEDLRKMILSLILSSLTTVLSLQEDGETI